mmetsp:Transcript_126/g.236  ORF Transcript_126/g.236 Transcript_126/m.236 type:complete len:106 (-) Transcript_126:284-601(-)
MTAPSIVPCMRKSFPSVKESTMSTMAYPHVMAGRRRCKLVKGPSHRIDRIGSVRRETYRRRGQRSRAQATKESQSFERTYHKAAEVVAKRCSGRTPISTTHPAIR